MLTLCSWSISESAWFNFAFKSSSFFLIPIETPSSAWAAPKISWLIWMIPKLENVIHLYYKLESAEDKNILLKSILAKVTYLKTEKAIKKESDPTNFELHIYPKIPKI